MNDWKILMNTFGKDLQQLAVGQYVTITNLSSNNDKYNQGNIIYWLRPNS